MKSKSGSFSLFIFFSLAFSFHSFGQGENGSKNTLIIPNAESIVRPILRDTFKYTLDSIKEVRLYHKKNPTQVNSFNQVIDEHIEEKLKVNLAEILNLLKSASVDSQYVEKTPDINYKLAMQVLFLTIDTRKLKDIYPTLEIFLANDGEILTVREYYYMNASNYYVLDKTSINLLKSSLSKMIDEYAYIDSQEQQGDDDYYEIIESEVK